MDVIEVIFASPPLGNGELANIKYFLLFFHLPLFNGA